MASDERRETSSSFKLIDPNDYRSDDEYVRPPRPTTKHGRWFKKQQDDLLKITNKYLHPKDKSKDLYYKKLVAVLDDFAMICYSEFPDGQVDEDFFEDAFEDFVKGQLGPNFVLRDTWFKKYNIEVVPVFRFHQDDDVGIGVKRSRYFE